MELFKEIQRLMPNEKTMIVKIVFGIDNFFLKINHKLKGQRI
jgi:hypothetical protein